ncbi:transposon ty3-I gag-pol polyprotein [Tanacetum coccineum]
MAENTRLKDLATTVERLSENKTQRDAREADHVNHLQNVETSLEAIHRSIEALTRSIERLSVPHSVTGVGGPETRHHQPFNVRQVKLDFPRFGGSDPLNWLFRAEQFFSYYDTPDAQRLTIASVHFEGSVVPWFQMLQKTHQVPNWVSLAKAIEDHFGPSQFDSPRAQLFKLTQTTSAAEYYHQFTVLANRVEGLSDEALMDCFLSGLKEPLRREVLAQTPTSLLRAGSLARLFDEKNSMGFISKTNSTLSGSSFKTTPVNSSLTSVSQTKFSSPSPLPPLLPKPQIKPLPHVKKLSPAEMQLRREKGLCFTCDEKYTWNHKCINKQCLVLLTTGDELEEPFKLDDYLNEKTEEEQVVDHHLSLNAFHGSQGLTTIRFTGTVNGTTVQVLLDGGSSDNFIQPRIVKHARLPLEPSKIFKVMVGNGNFLQSEGLINSVPLQIQGHVVKFPAYALPISGADIILGAPWLATLGSHIADYRTSTIKFYTGNQFITLVGDPSSVPAEAQFHHFKRLTATDAIAEAYTIH